MSTAGQQPIFIVGSPRSGTTLLAGLLGAHSRMVCGPETEFFTVLQPANRGNQLCRAATWPDEAANYLCSITHEQPIHEYYGISRLEVIAFLKHKKRHPSTILESLTVPYMTRHGKQRWVEKTPTHLIYTREIRRCYPDAPIIRIIRDPRDVALSLLNVPWGPSTFAAACLHWQFFDERSARFFETDRNTRTVRFEDLVQHPEEELRKLCDFIGEEFEPGMMDTSESVTHVNPTRITWKQKAGQQLDPSRIGVWQRETTVEQQSQAEALIGDRLRYYGYATIFKFIRYINIINLGILAHFPVLADHLLDGDTRFWKTHFREAPRMRVFLGDPCTDGWIGGYRSARLAKVLHVAGCAAGALVTGIPLIWLGAPPTKEVRNWGFLCRCLAKLLPRRLEIEAFCQGQLEPVDQHPQCQR
jgi:hypothetical protein